MPSDSPAAASKVDAVDRADPGAAHARPAGDGLAQVRRVAAGPLRRSASAVTTSVRRQSQRTLRSVTRPAGPRCGARARRRRGPAAAARSDTARRRQRAARVERAAGRAGRRGWAGSRGSRSRSSSAAVQPAAPSAAAPRCTGGPGGRAARRRRRARRSGRRTSPPRGRRPRQTTPRSWVISRTRHAELACAAVEQFEDLRLHRHVQRGGRLVGDDAARARRAMAIAIRMRWRMPPENWCG